jgi:hypothetical protein
MNRTLSLGTLAALTILAVTLAGCTYEEQAGPVKANAMNIIGGGVAQDIPARIYQEYGLNTACKAYSPHPDHASYPTPCPSNNGYPHVGAVCTNMKWSVQFRNDHPTDSNEAKYGLPYDSQLINSLQQWRADKQELRFYWVRYSDTECKFTENEVIYCVELTSLSLKDSEDHGCIKAMHRTFPGLNTAWDQALNFAVPSNGVADASAGAEGGGA